MKVEGLVIQRMERICPEFRVLKLAHSPRQKSFNWHLFFVKQFPHARFLDHYFAQKCSISCPVYTIFPLKCSISHQSVQFLHSIRNLFTWWISPPEVRLDGAFVANMSLTFTLWIMTTVHTLLFSRKKYPRIWKHVLYNYAQSEAIQSNPPMGLCICFVEIYSEKIFMGKPQYTQKKYFTHFSRIF